MKGYYKNPEATRSVLKDGWLYTGDMAKQDKDGLSIWWIGRKMWLSLVEKISIR